MKLSELLKSVSEVEVFGFFELDVTSVTANSGECTDGSVFVARKGARYDGCDFIREAYERGARVFVLSEKRALPKGSVAVYSQNTRKTLAELLSAICGHPEKDMLFVGITGTKGKTTTSILLSKILDGIGVKNIIVGTLGILGMPYRKTLNTTPDPTVLFPLFKEALSQGVKVVILEVSSQALKDFRVYKIPFTVVAFTGIGKDHIGKSEHASFSDYIFSKRTLFNDYGASCAVVNFDDPYSSYISSGVEKVIKCGFSHSSDFLINKFCDSDFGSEFYVRNTKIVSSLPGEYNARNISIALAMARQITGVSIHKASGYVSRVEIKGRFEKKKIDGKNIIIDYAHNADSFREVANLSRRIFDGKVIFVFGSVGERSFNRRRELAMAAEKYADFSVITSDNSGSELPLSICADIYSKFKDKTRAKIIVERAQAISYAISVEMPGYTVLVLGKGHENTISAYGKTFAFSDSEFVDNYRI